MKVLITGASSGFGNLTAFDLLKKGHQVAATMRDVGTRNKPIAEELKKAGATVIEMDVANDASVNKGVADVAKQLGGIDVVVNNAGIGALGIQETFSIEEWKRLFDINVFGALRVNRAVLPQMRAKKSGLLIHVSSLLGRFTLPFMGPYNSSKFALEALAQNYSMELKSFGIESVVVEPGAYGTDFGTRMIYPADAERVATYGDFVEAPKKQMIGFGKFMESQKNPPDVQNVVKAIVGLIQAKPGTRPFRTVVDDLGMGEPIVKYNKASDVAQEEIGRLFGK